MSFVVIGLNHATSPLDVLEQVTVAPDDLDKALHDVSRRPHISEAVVVSTCNRTEVYVVAERFHGAFQDVRDFLCSQSFLPPERLADHLYTLYDDDAVRHLFQVSAGIDSAVVGEHEILGQVKRSWQAAQQHGCVGPMTNGVFRSAVEVGKRVRTETGISRNIASVSQAAIVLAEEHLGDLAGRRALLIGAGEMGTGMARTLAQRDLETLTLCSRTHETAATLADEVAAGAIAFDQIPDGLLSADVVFTSTAAPDAVVSVEQIAAAMAQRQRPLLIIDVAMPRDVEPAVGELDGVTLCDLDTVGTFVAAGLESRSAEIDAARSIVEDGLERHIGDASARAVDPLITDFRSRAETIRSAELTRVTSRDETLTAEQIAVVDEVTRAVLAKVLHTPTVRLKESAATLRGERLAAAVRELFDLD